MSQPDSPLFSLIGIAVGAYLLWMWIQDYRTRREDGTAPSKFLLPGTTPGTGMAWVIASAGAVFWVVMFSVFEWQLGVWEEQSTIGWHFIFAMLGAAVTEEIVFRGYLIILNRGRLLRIFSALLFSTLFALIHPYLWTHGVESPSGIEWLTTLQPKLTMQTGLATLSVWTLSLWFYYSRLAGWNKNHSLIPCFCAHASANLVVYGIKACSGFVSW